MKIEWNSKYTTISVYTIITFLICFIFVIIAREFETVSLVLKTIAQTLSPVIWGIAIAYLLNPIMKKSEVLFKKLFEKDKKRPKLCRILAVAVAMLFGFAVISGLVAIIVPQVYDSILSIVDNIQVYSNNIYKFVDSTLSEYPEVVTYLTGQLDSIKDYVTKALNDILPQMGNWFIKLKDGALGLIIGLKDFILGFIIAVYLLFDKEKFIAQSKKLITALFPKSVSTEIFRLSNRTNHSVSGFISGKILDSFIIGMICFICMTVMKLEYPVLISTIVGVTNVIPFFGPFIGAIPSALLIFIAAPSQTLPFILLILIIQQFDGNILGPHILGDSTGLPAFWVIFAIFIGGGLFGFGGMLLGVPIFAVIYAIIEEITELLLAKKGEPVETEAYFPIEINDTDKKKANPKKTKKGGTAQ